MKTNARLDAAYENAKTIEIDENSKIIIMSDMHRGDNSISDEFAHNQNIFLHAINHYLKEGYEYIENGDGDELWEHSKLRHIRFAHNDVFDIIKEFHKGGRYHLIYGNHNMEYKYESYIKDNLWVLFDLNTEKKEPFLEGIKVHEALKLVHSKSGLTLFVVHGHQGDFMNDQMWKVSRFWLRYFWRLLHVIGFKNPASPAKSRHKRHKIERRYVKWVKHSHHLLIVGHTHRPKFPYPDDENPYFNTGSSVRPRSITGIEINNDQISLVEWRTWPNEEGILQVIKRDIGGPVYLCEYAKIFD